MVSRMDTTPLTALHSDLVRPRTRELPLARGFAWLGGVVTAAAALAIGAVLAVFAAAAVAVLAVTTAVLVFLAGLALRARRSGGPGGTVLQARRVGHAWVAYGWDRSVR